jgi:hypothetical protein
MQVVLVPSFSFVISFKLIYLVLIFVISFKLTSLV